MADSGDFDAKREELRDRVRASAGNEDELVEILAAVNDWAASDPDLQVPDELTTDRAYEVLGVIEAWASLASYATQEFYGEDQLEVGTPFRRFPGWAQQVPQRLRELADRFVVALKAIARELHVNGFSIGVAFPIGYQ